MLTIYNHPPQASIEAPTNMATQTTEATSEFPAPASSDNSGSDNSGSDLESQSEANIALAPEEIATLTSLVSRYDQLLLEVDALNQRIEDLLKSESPPTKQ